MMLLAAVFSISTGVGGCWCPISARAVLVEVAFWQFKKKSPNSTSMADAISFLVMLHSTSTGPLSGAVSCISVSDFSPRKKYFPALFCAFGYNMYNASK